MMQWLVTAYLLMSGGGLLLGGRIADLLPRRRVFLTGIAVFTTASLSRLRPQCRRLIAARATQGLSAAVMTPAALSLIMTTYTGGQRAKGLALWGAVGSMGIAAGVLFGGALTTWAGWQTIFWVNVPVGIVAFVASPVLPHDQPERARAGSTSLVRSPSLPVSQHCCRPPGASGTAGPRRTCCSSPRPPGCSPPLSLSSAASAHRWCRRTPGQ